MVKSVRYLYHVSIAGSAKGSRLDSFIHYMSLETLNFDHFYPNSHLVHPSVLTRTVQTVGTSIFLHSIHSFIHSSIHSFAHTYKCHTNNHTTFKCRILSCFYCESLPSFLLYRIIAHLTQFHEEQKEYNKHHTNTTILPDEA